MDNLNAKSASAGDLFNIKVLLKINNSFYVKISKL